jgi:hypothetical protein
MIIHTRVGKLARYANLNRKKTSAIKMDRKYQGQFVVVISRGEYRELVKRLALLKRRLKRIGGIVVLCRR